MDFGTEESKFAEETVRLLPLENWEKPYSEVHGYVNARMIIVIVRAAHLCLGGSHLPTSKMSKRLRQSWEDKAGLGLFRHHEPSTTIPVTASTFLDAIASVLPS
jgi:hypothetical protein